MPTDITYPGAIPTNRAALVITGTPENSIAPVLGTAYSEMRWKMTKASEPVSWTAFGWIIVIAIAVIGGGFIWLQSSVTGVGDKIFSLNSSVSERLDKMNGDMDRRLDAINSDMNKRLDAIIENTKH